jgi:hypothetical protein
MRLTFVVLVTYCTVIGCLCKESVSIETVTAPKTEKKTWTLYEMEILYKLLLCYQCEDHKPVVATYPTEECSRT